MNSPSPLISEPRFPPDLEREIFEICALSRPRTIPSLMLVASRVKEWVEPLLYRIIAVSDSRNESLPPFTCDILVRTIRAKPVHFLAKYVRHLYLTPGRRNDREHVSDILPACTGVTSLFTLWALHDAVFLTLLENMHSLRQLAVSVSSLFVPNNGFEHRLFRNITHLEALSTIDVPPSTWAELSHLPNLTHFSFWSTTFLAGAADAFLVAYPQLQCVAFLAAHPSNMAGAAAACVRLVSDPRFVAVLLPQGYEREWVRGTISGHDYWDRADAFLAAKKAGKVESSEYHC